MPNTNWIVRYICKYIAFVSASKKHHRRLPFDLLAQVFLLYNPTMVGGA